MTGVSVDRPFKVGGLTLKPVTVRALLAVLIFATLTASIFWRYFQGTYLAGSDAMGPFYDLEIMKVDNSFFSTWRNVTSLGYLNYPSPTLSAFFYVTVGMLGLDVTLLWKVIIITSFWAAGFLMFVCAYKISGSYVGGLVAGVVYSLNQVFLSQVTEVHHYFILGYALFPLLFLLFYRAVDGTGRYSILTVPIVALIFGTTAAPNTVLITGVFLLIFTFVFAWLSRSAGKRKVIDRLGLGVVCVLLVVLPMVLMKFSGGGTPSLDIHYSIEDAKSYSSYSIYHSLILASSENTFIQGTDGGEWVYPSFLMPLGLLLALIVPIVAFLSLLVKTKRSMILALIVPSILFIFMAKGPNFPGGGLFSFLFSNVPLMDSLRVYSRLNLLTGFAYALLISMVLANLDDVRVILPRLNGRLRKVADRLLDKRVLTCLIVVAMVVPSSAIFLANEPRSFDLPSEYAEPYTWLRGQDGDFRVLNLPYQQVYYTSGSNGTEGYPATMTLDPGMYSPLISNKAYAYGVETADYWSFLGNTLNERRYGYKEVPQVFGGVAGVRYVVSQVQTAEEEKALFASLDGMSLTTDFEGGGAIYENSQWTSRLHTLDHMCLLVGNRADIVTAMGLGLVNLTTDGVLLSDEINNLTELKEYLDQTDMIVLTDSDLLRLAAELDWPGAESVDLASLADSHTTQADATWVQSNAYYYSGVVSGLTAETTGAHTLTTTMDAKSGGAYDLLISTVGSPDSGKITIALDGNNVTTLYPYSSSPNERWVRVSNITLDEGSHSISLTSDGSGNCSLGKMIVAPRSEVEDRLSVLGALLEEHSDKVAYMVGASSSLWSNGTTFPWMGSEGQGVSSVAHFAATDFQNPTLVVDGRAYGGLAMIVDPRGQAYSPTIHGLIGGSNYTMALSVNNPGSNSTSCQVEVWGGSNGTMSLIYVSSVMIPPGNGYQEQTINFTLPQGMEYVQAQIYAGENGLRVDQLTMSPEQQVVPELNIEVMSAGDYVLNLAGGNGTVVIDGRAVRSSSLVNGIYSYDVGFLWEGSHTLKVGSEGVYAMDVVPSGAAPASSTAANLSYQRISNVEYEVKVGSDGPVWILLSESYNAMWYAEVDGTPLEHVRVDSMVNAFYIPEGGNHTVTIHFQGQDTYSSIVWTLVGVLVASTAVFSVVLLYRTRPSLFHRKKE